LFENLEWQLSCSSLKERNVKPCRCAITVTVPFYLYNKFFNSINPVFPLGIISWYPNEYNVWFFQSVENFVECLISHYPRGLQIITEWNREPVKEAEFCACQGVWFCGAATNKQTNTHTHTHTATYDCFRKLNLTETGTTWFHPTVLANNIHRSRVSQVAT